MQCGIEEFDCSRSGISSKTSDIDPLPSVEGVDVQDTVTTGLALVPKTSSAVYCGTKGGWRLFTKALQNQLEETSIRTIDILPPVVDTPMTAGRGKNKMSSKKVAHEIVRALKGGRDEVFVGKTKLLHWVSRLSPGMARRIMKRLG